MGIFSLFLSLLLIPIIIIIISVIALLIKVLGVFYSSKHTPKKKSSSKYKYGEAADNLMYNKIREYIEDKKANGEKIFDDDYGEYIDYDEIY